jgi:arylsulfatase A-like enzyme
MKHISLALALIFGCPSVVDGEAGARPNVIFLLADDLRWDTLGCAGNEIIRTPNIDRLAKEGVSFRNTFATTSICMVSRASILTGQYGRRHGIGDFNTPLSPAQWRSTYPALLRAAGYRTGFIGKFGVGDANAIAAMADKFDYWRGLPGQGGEYFIDPADPTKTHATAKFGNQALEFIDGCTAEQPFCLSLSFNAPHARDGKPREFRPDLRDESLYASDIIPYPPNANEEAFARLPAFLKESEGRRRWMMRFATPEMFQRTMRDYYRLVTGIDREVGRIIEQLEKRGLTENTVIVFTSDNGWFAGDYGLAGKWLMYEESVRLPLIVFDPRLPQTRRGQSVEPMALNVDFGPTLLDIAGVEVPASMQGRSLLPLVAGDFPENWREDFYYEHHFAPKRIPPSEGVRTEQWSYIRWVDPNPETEELYNLADDPNETHDLSKDPVAAGELERLRVRMADLRQRLK